MKPLLAFLVALSPLLAPGPAAAQEPTDPADFQAAVDHELAGVQVDGTLDVAVHDDGTATVTYTRKDGRKIVRTVRLPERRDDAIETVALLAGNLVRDQMSGFAEPEPAVVPASPPAAPSAPAAGVVQAVAPPRLVPFELGLVPPASTDLAYGGPAAHRFALHAVAGDGRGVRGASGSGAVDVQRGAVDGVQLAGAVNVATGPVGGVQLAGALNVATAGSAGAQLAGAVNVASAPFAGAQVAGGVNVSLARFSGLQVAGALNVADESHGAQVAPLNVARHQHGLQLGVVNYADGDPDDGLSLGVISIVRHGITEVDASAETYGGMAATLRHGRRRFYNLYGAATTFNQGKTAQMYGLGFGSRVAQRTLGSVPIDVDLDAMAWGVRGSAVTGDHPLLARARLALGARFGWITVFGGVAANCFVGDQGERGDAFDPVLDHSFVDGDATVRLWPSLFAGIRVQ
jgi:hypothetical protein